MDDLEKSQDAFQRQQFNEFDKIRETFHRSSLINLSLKNMHLPFLTNIGIEDSENDKIIILESDRLLPKGYFASVLNELKEGVCITCKNMKKLAKTATDEEITNETFEFKDEWRSEDAQIGMRNMWSGNTAICKSDYYKAGKMDEAYIGYGWADTDMSNRMSEIGIKSIFRPEVELHLWHPLSTYGEGDQKQQFINNGVHFCKKWNAEYPEWFKQEILMHKGTTI